MKKIKKLASFLLALGMIFALSATAFAADDGSITIENATVGETYAVYKVFDLTYSDANGTVAYSYTRTGTDDALYDVLRGADSPFTLTATTTENVYAVSLQDGKTATDVSKFLSANESLLTQTGDTMKANTTTVTFNNLPYGYYYITSSLGAVVTIDSAMPNATVIDKNQTPGWDPEDPENPGESGEQGKFVAAAEDGDFAKTSTAAIGDTAYFKINAYAPKYAGDKLVATYTFTDTLAVGFTYNSDLVVKIGNKVLTENTDYTVTQNDQEITVVVKAGTIDSYPTDAHLSITYSATVDKDAVYDNTNTVNMKWTVYPNDPDTGDPDPNKPPYDPNDPTDPNYPKDPETGAPIEDPNDPENPSGSKTDTYVFGFNLQKYKESAAEGNELDGAKFKLYDDATGGNEIAVVKIDDGAYRVASAEERAVEGFASVEIEAGTAQIFGLDAKTYYLEETAAPDGYNMLKSRVEVTISDADNTHTDGIQNTTTDVVNKSGSLLPSTGGIGTTIFYVLGGVLVVGAGVLLIVRRRMSSEK